MGGFQKLTLIGLLALVGAAIAGLILTSNSGWHGGSSLGETTSATGRMLAPHEELLATAERLEGFAATPRERQLAELAGRTADQELDLAFADALRAASEQPSTLSGPARALQIRIAQLSAGITDAGEQIKSLTAEQTRAKGARLASLQERIELAQAGLSLDRDALADAQRDLARAGGDAYSEIQRLWQQHEATQHSKEEKGETGSAQNAGAVSAPSRATVIAEWRYWRALGAEHAQLIEARQQALDIAGNLAREHAALEKQIEAEQPQKEALSGGTAGTAPPSKSQGAAGAPGKTRRAISLLHHLSAGEKTLADLDSRILDLRSLTATYDQWSGEVKGRERSALHGIILSALWIILTILFVWLASLVAEHAFNRIGLERRQLVTLRGVVRFSTEALGLVTVLLVIFGAPANLSTVLGLAGAGLTVALKDFIISFFGWFTLMGRRGIRVGDWVEINGVRGEVIEVTLLRTVLLETGNWTEPGHPTGRQVTFLNSYAVEGYFFNFTTTGQWLWDEVTLLIPWGVDPYPVIEQIERVVTSETGSGAKTAEVEWQRATRGYSVKSFSAAPAVNVRSMEEGVEVTIRYITRANERYGLRFRLSNAAVKLIHEAKSSVAKSPWPPAKGSETTHGESEPLGG